MIERIEKNNYKKYRNYCNERSIVNQILVERSNRRGNGYNSEKNLRNKQWSLPFKLQNEEKACRRSSQIKCK